MRYNKFTQDLVNFVITVGNIVSYSFYIYNRMANKAFR